VVLQFFHRAGAEAVCLQADDSLVAGERGLGEPLAEVQAGDEQPCDRAVIGTFGREAFQLADDLMEALLRARSLKAWRVTKIPLSPTEADSRLTK
jgi:hypothetical protein